MIRWPNMMITLVLALIASTGVAQAEGTAQQSNAITDGYVGSPIPFDIIIKDAKEWDPPVMPDVAGLQIERRNGGQSSSIKINNGVRTESSQITYTFLITAKEPGTYEIPSFPITIDGRTLNTLPVELTYRTSENHGLLSAEVFGSPSRIVQGESTTLTLQVLIKQYTDARYSISPDSREMWSLVDASSDWGPFTDTMIEMYNNRRAPRGRIQTFQDEVGERQNYYLYQVQAEVRPTSTGPLDVSNIQLKMKYPVTLRRDQGFFGTGMKIDQVRNVTAVATSSGIEIAPLPSQGRPSIFNGAVGSFSITTTASPTTVAVGDPITLVMTITDQGDTSFDMDVLPAPELDKIEELDAEFRVPREALAGVVKGRTKTFTQTIRARSDKVTSIPPISYAYFDPTSNSYEISQSRPILLDVSPSETITSSDIVGANNTSVTGDDLNNVAGGLLANYTGAGRLLSNQGPPASWWLLLLLITPPLAVLGIAVTRQSVRGHLGDPDRVRSRRAGRVALNSLANVSAAPQQERGARIAEAICTYVADRIGVPPAGFMRGDATAILQACQVDPDLVREVDQLVSQCDHLQYAGGGDSNIVGMVDAARSLINRLESIPHLKTNKQVMAS